MTITTITMTITITTHAYQDRQGCEDVAHPSYLLLVALVVHGEDVGLLLGLSGTTWDSLWRLGTTWEDLGPFSTWESLSPNCGESGFLSVVCIIKKCIMKLSYLINFFGSIISLITEDFYFNLDSNNQDFLLRPHRIQCKSSSLAVHQKLLEIFNLSKYHFSYSSCRGCW